MANTKKMATKKVAAPAKGGKKIDAKKFNIALLALGWIVVVLLVLGALAYFVIDGIVTNKSVVEDIGIALIIVSQVASITVGALLIVKAKKVDAEPKVAKGNLIMGILIIVGIVLIIAGIALMMLGVSQMVMYIAILGLALAQVTEIVATIMHTIRFAKANKGAKKAAK